MKIHFEEKFMKVIRHFTTQFLVILFILTTCISLLLLTFIGSIQLLCSKDNIVTLVNQVNFREFIGPKAEDDLYQLLEQTGLPRKYVDYIIENKVFRTYIGSYLAEEMESILYHKETPIIDTQEFTNILLESFDQAIQVLEEENIDEKEILSSQDQHRIRQKIEYFVPRIVEKIPQFDMILEYQWAGQETISDIQLKQLQTALQVLRWCYQWKPILSLFILVQLGVIFLLKIKKFHYIKWFMVPFLTTGTILWYFKTQLPILLASHLPKHLIFMKAFLEQTMSFIYTSWNRTIIICLTLSILFIFLQILIRFIQVHSHRNS